MTSSSNRRSRRPAAALGLVLALVGLGGGGPAEAAHDEGGGTQWARQFGTPEYDEARSVAVAGDGSVYVAANTDSFPSFRANGDGELRKYDAGGTHLWTLLLEPGVSASSVAVDAHGSVYLAGGACGANCFFDTRGVVRKYDGEGNEVWRSEFGDPNRENGANAVAVDGNGAVYMAGFVSGSRPGPGGSRNVIVKKYAAGDGAELWSREFSVMAVDEASALALGGDGGVFVAGFAGFGGPNRPAPFLRRYDSDGALTWARRLPELSDVRGLAADAAGNVYVVGRQPAEELGASVGFVRQFSAEGDEVWVDLLADDVTGVALDADGSRYVAGNTRQSPSGQPGLGASDAFVRKYGGGGGDQWTRHLGTTARDAASDVAVADGGAAIVVGATEGIFAGEASAGGNDAFVARVSPGGADLSLAAWASAEAVRPGKRLTYTLTVTNDGPAAATSVVLEDVVPRGLKVVRVTAGQGRCHGRAIVQCDLGQLGAHDVAVVQIEVRWTKPGPVENRASISAHEFDPDHADNAAVVVTTVDRPGPKRR